MARETIPGSPPAGGVSPRPNWKSWAALAVVLLGMYAWDAYSAQRDAHPAISYTAFYTLVTDGKVESIAIRGQVAMGQLKGPEMVEGHSVTNFTTMLPASPEPDLFPSLRKQGVKVIVQNEEQPPLVKLLVGLLPWVLIIGVWFVLSRSAQKMMQGGGPFGGITKSRSHRFVQESGVKIKFDDVAGLKAAK